MPYQVSIHTRGRKNVTLEELIALFGRAPVEGVPENATGAEVLFEPGEAVKVVWTCVATPELVEKLAPELKALEDGRREKFGAFKRRFATPATATSAEGSE